MLQPRLPLHLHSIMWPPSDTEQPAAYRTLDDRQTDRQKGGRYPEVCLVCAKREAPNTIQQRTITSTYHLNDFDWRNHWRCTTLRCQVSTFRQMASSREFERQIFFLHCMAWHAIILHSSFFVSFLFDAIHTQQTNNPRRNLKANTVVL